jgi:hypothetical protein
MMCARCDEPIRPGEQSTTYPVFGESGAAPSVELHDVCPVQPPPVKRYQ